MPPAAAQLALRCRTRVYCAAMCKRIATFALLAVLAGACGSPGADPWVGTPPVPPAADVTVLMMGNSHTAFNALPQQLDTMLRAGLAGPTVATAEAPGWMFLDQRLADAASMRLLDSRRWSAVVLQAQRYSTTGRYSYSTAEAVELVREIATAYYA